MRKVPLKCSVRSQQAQGGVNAGPNATDENRRESRAWHTLRQSAPTVWLRRPRDPAALAGMHRAAGVNAGPNATDENQAAAVLESQLPHKIVNLLFELVTVNNKLTILWGI